MAKILYGVSGEGSGHSTRARVVARHLLQTGHEVRLASYDRGYRNLSEEFQVLEIEGLTIGSRDNRVSLRKTLQANLQRLAVANERFDRLRRLITDFRPHVVLCDFEPMSAYLAHHYHLPLITLDNQQRMRYLNVPVPLGLEMEARLTRAVIRAIVPKPDVSLITTFVRGAPRHDRVFQFAPIVDPQVAALRSKVHSASDAPVLVYATSGFDTLLDSLRQLDSHRFHIYGCPAAASAPRHLQFFAPSREGFLNDLARCRGVIATAGFTLISEALCLGKPYLAYPMHGQYEQQLNAHQLEASGLGRRGTTAEAKEVAEFLNQLASIEQRLKQYPGSDLTPLLSKLDELLEDDAALAHAYRRQRKGSVLS